MAHSLSAKKRVRQNAKRRADNRARRATVKSSLKSSQTAIGGTDVKAAESQLAATIRLLDREANKGLIHKNAAARQKSKLTRKLNALKTKGGK